jgi:hypothetical protein
MNTVKSYLKEKEFHVYVIAESIGTIVQSTHKEEEMTGEVATDGNNDLRRWKRVRRKY